MKILEFPPAPNLRRWLLDAIAPSTTSPFVVAAIDRNILIADRERFDRSPIHRYGWVGCFGIMLLLMTLWTNTAGAQGALTNGWTHMMTAGL